MLRCSQIRLSESSETYSCLYSVLLIQGEVSATFVSVVNTAVAGNPALFRTASRRCAVLRIGCVKNHLSAVCILSARRGLEIRQSLVGSSNGRERYRSRHISERLPYSPFHSPVARFRCSIQHASLRVHHWFGAGLLPYTRLFPRGYILLFP